jgi:hypothetical protein
VAKDVMPSLDTLQPERRRESLVALGASAAAASEAAVQSWASHVSATHVLVATSHDALVQSALRVQRAPRPAGSGVPSRTGDWPNAVSVSRISVAWGARRENVAVAEADVQSVPMNREKTPTIALELRSSAACNRKRARPNIIEGICR